MDEIVERFENNFINIYKKFDKINEMIDIIISDEYTKIHKTYFPMKNYDLAQDRFLYTTNSLIYHLSVFFPFDLTKPNHVSPLYSVKSFDILQRKERAIIHIRS